MRSAERVRRYFDRTARRFDSIYEASKPVHQRLVDRVFRGVMIDRFRLIMDLAPMSKAWTALDVGCGSGRYSIALSKAGASRVLGIDFSERMVNLAREEAERAGVDSACQFVCRDFLEYPADETFDVVVATGYFDYLENPLPHFAVMKRLCRGRLFASFPKRWEWRVPTRKLRFLLQKGFVRFYSRKDVECLLAMVGIKKDQFKVMPLSRDWIVVVESVV